MSASTLRSGSIRSVILSALLLASIGALQPASADDGLEIGSDGSGDNSEYVYLDNDGDDDDEGVVGSDPSEPECGESVENSRC